MIKVVLLTSNSLRHKYIANQLAMYFDLQLIVTEKKSPKIEDTSLLSRADSIFVQRHFEARAINEKKFFKDYQTFPINSKHIQINHNEINSKNIFSLLCKMNPDRILLFGTSIIRNPILSKFKDRILNLHLGLSPYYKGSATNLFPIIFNELTCVGATIHVVNAKVDQGPILHQIRPDLRKADALHDIGNKTILKAGQVLPMIIKKHYDDLHIGKIQKEAGKVFQIKDLSVKLLRMAYLNIENGILEEYLNAKRRIDLKYPIIVLK